LSSVITEFYVIGREYKLETSEEQVKASIAMLEPILDVYEQILSKQKYLAGDVIF